MKRATLWATFAAAILLLVDVGTAAEQPTESPQTPRARPAESVTLYPIVLSTTRTIPDSLPERLAEVVGTLLERSGMESIEISEAPFAIAPDEKLAETSRRFSAHVRAHPGETAAAVLGQIIADEKTITEIRTIVVDRRGQVLLAESVAGDGLAEAEVPPRDPMTACVFLVDRLGKVWRLEDPRREDAPQGKMAQRMRQRSGIPPQDQLAAMQAREQALRENDRPRTLAVYPIHLWQGWDREHAKELADALTGAELFSAKIAGTPPTWDVPGDPNQQKVLWDTARRFRKHLRAEPARSDFALLVDCGLTPDQEQPRAARHVHLVLCTGDGEWVLVDYQNSHHPDYQRLSPKSTEQCVRLALVRLQKRLAGKP